MINNSQPTVTQLSSSTEGFQNLEKISNNIFNNIIENLEKSFNNKEYKLHFDEEDFKSVFKTLYFEKLNPNYFNNKHLLGYFTKYLFESFNNILENFETNNIYILTKDNQKIDINIINNEKLNELKSIINLNIIDKSYIKDYFTKIKIDEIKPIHLQNQNNSLNNDDLIKLIHFEFIIINIFIYFYIYFKDNKYKGKSQQSNIIKDQTTDTKFESIEILNLEKFNSVSSQLYNNNNNSKQ